MLISSAVVFYRAVSTLLLTLLAAKADSLTIQPLFGHREVFLPY